MAGVPFRVLWCQGKQGKSIMRILTNWVLAQWRDEVKGLVLDLACGTEPSYRRILGLTEIAHERLVSVDYNPACRPTIVADLTRTLPSGIRLPIPPFSHRSSTSRLSQLRSYRRFAGYSNTKGFYC